MKKKRNKERMTIRMEKRRVSLFCSTITFVLTSVKKTSPIPSVFTVSQSPYLSQPGEDSSPVQMLSPLVIMVALVLGGLSGFLMFQYFSSHSSSK